MTMRPAQLFAIATLSLSLLSISGCNAKDSQDLTRDVGKLAESGTRSLVNASVAVKVQTALSLRKGVDPLGFKVQSEGGVVTLSGSVKTKKEKLLVLEIARETRGVEKLIDKVEIKP